MPRTLVIIFTAIMIAGGAITLMQQLEIGPFAPAEPEQTEEQKKQAAILKPKEPSLPRFVDMEPIVLTVILGDRAALTLQLSLQIETTEEKEAVLHKSLTKLKDAYIRDMHSFVPRLYRKSPTLDTEALKRRLKVIGARTIGKGIIEAALIQNKLERRLPR